jgi:hypothetical protein
MAMRSLMNTSIALALAFLCGVQAYNISLMFYDPFFYHYVRAVTPKVPRGGLFVEELEVQRYRVCKVEIDRFMISVATGDVIYRERVPGGASPIGRNVARNSLRIPADAPLGQTRLIQNVSSQCIEGMHTMAWPIIEFEITE